MLARPRNAVRDGPPDKRLPAPRGAIQDWRGISDAEQVSAILHYAPARCRPLLVVAAFTGSARQGFVAFNWKDVDIKKCKITVAQRADS